MPDGGQVEEVGSGSIELDARGEVVKATLRGEFDMANVPELERLLRSALQPGTELVLDVEGVTFMDSQMLHLLVRLQNDLKARRGRLRLHPNLNLSQLLTLSGLAPLFDLVDGE